MRWDTAKQRYIVRLDGGQEFALRQINLVQLVEGVVLVGLSKQDLNGSKGSIRGWDSGKGRYVVRLNNGAGLAVMPCNVLLPKNTRVLLQGLSNARQVLWQSMSSRLSSFIYCECVSPRVSSFIGNACLHLSSFFLLSIHMYVPKPCPASKHHACRTFGVWWALLFD